MQFPDNVEQELGNAYGQERWQSIKSALANPPMNTAVRVNTMRTTREDVIVGLREALAAFNAFLDSDGRGVNVEPIPHPLLPDVILIPSAPPLKNGSTRFREDCKSIVVDRLCGEAVLRGSDIYARGIMSASSGINAGDDVNLFVDLDHVSTRGISFEEHNGRKLYIGQGKTHMPRSEMFRATRGLAVGSIRRVCTDAPSMNGVLDRDIYVQNLPSTVVAHVLDPQPGDCIFDMCAAPGGKTSHIAMMMQNQGTLVACDRSRRKAQALHQLFQDLSLDCVHALKMDSTQSVLPKTLQRRDGSTLSVREVLEQARAAASSPSAMLQVPGFYPETFDKILLDPPCSALGLRPRLLHPRDANALEEFCSMQRNFLWAAVFLLKPGGTLVYSTCTINPKENEAMVRHALDNYPLRLEPQKPHLGESGLLNQGLDKTEAAMVQRFDPSSAELDTMGFFCAKFTKTASFSGSSI